MAAFRVIQKSPLPASQQLNPKWLIPIGVACLLGAALLSVQRFFFLQAGLRAEGVIVSFKTEVKRDTDGDRRVIYTPIVKYLARDGNEYQFIDNTGSSFEPRINRRVTVLYDPAKPTEAEIYGPIKFWGAPIIVAILGIFSILCKLLWAPKQSPPSIPPSTPSTPRNAS